MQRFSASLIDSPAATLFLKIEPQPPLPRRVERFAAECTHGNVMTLKTCRGISYKHMAPLMLSSLM